jgi:hypothetical protein
MSTFSLSGMGLGQYFEKQGGAVNRGLYFADLSLLGAVSGKISKNRWAVVWTMA